MSSNHWRRLFYSQSPLARDCIARPSAGPLSYSRADDYFDRSVLTRAASITAASRAFDWQARKARLININVNHRRISRNLLFRGRASSRPSICILHPGRVGADDHPFVSALNANIHKTPVAASVLPVVASLFGDSALEHGNIVEHLHVHRSNFKGLEFMLAGFQIVQ
jgi:hypothetical protein